jgi:hypothetical protein
MIIDNIDYSVTEIREMIRRFLVEKGYDPNGDWYFLKPRGVIDIRINPLCTYSYNTTPGIPNERVDVYFNGVINGKGDFICYKIYTPEDFKEVLGFIERIGEATASEERLKAIYSNLEDVIKVGQL